MVCPKCGKEGLEPGDAFCRHCGFSLTTPTSVPGETAGVTEKKPVKEATPDASKGLLIFGSAIFLITGFVALIAGYATGLPNFSGTVFPWLAGSLMLVGLVMMFVGFGLRRAH